MRQLAGADGHHISVETPTQPQHTLKCMILDPASAHEPVTFERLRTWAAAALPQVAPFRWQLAPPPMGLGHPFWVDRPELDVDYHVRVTRVAAPGGREELAAVLGQLLGGELLDRSRPLWQLWLVEGLAESRVALVWKVHHSLADGVASVRMFSAVLQHGPDERPVVPEAAPSPDPDPTRRRLFLRMVRSVVPNAAHLPALVNRSLRATRIGRERRREGLEGPARAFASPATRFNRTFTAHRSCAWASLAMSDLKTVRAAFGCTVNDVLVAVCSGAIRSYLERSRELPRTSLSASIPVSVRQEHELDDYGNRLTTWFVTLATDVADPVERLRANRAATRAARASHAARHSETLVEEWMDYKGLWRRWIAFGTTAAGLARRPSFNTIVSNVRGPEPLWFDGAPVVEILSVGELAMGLGLNLTGWSYRDRIAVGVAACPEHVPDLWDLVDGLPVALAELVEAARVAVASLTEV
ncbi:MAG: wax ester/triacylglycerol synthase family O-acyltransferase [Acidimicrobiia bacterium]|nr:wax ester/triacylglycerol synthase family O-acyltransferase [Acidimicrobiia bacterium]